MDQLLETLIFSHGPIGAIIVGLSVWLGHVAVKLRSLSREVGQVTNSSAKLSLILSNVSEALERVTKIQESTQSALNALTTRLAVVETRQENHVKPRRNK
mgnify:CR=1 FL=1